MSINVKKYTKDQMAKMVEDAQAEVQELKRVNAALTEQISQMNGEAITRENVIANLKADADALRNKLDDTEAALGRANACIATMKVERDSQTKDCFEWMRSAQNLHGDLLNARERAHYAEAHPWRNLWAWAKRKLARQE
nr:MAG TPA: Microtubule-binding stalk of dynein motor [Caudoviricetes sp.]